MKSFDEWRQWASDPVRTVDELCALEVITEWGQRIWRGRRERYVDDFERQRAHRNERAGNPAYRPTIDPTALARTAEEAATLKTFLHSYDDDRPLRSIAPLALLPAIEDLTLGNAELSDLSPLQALPRLRKLHLHEPVLSGGHVTRDLEALAALAGLENLSLSLRTAWPDLRALARLPALRSLTCRANLLALREVSELPAVTLATLHSDFHWKTPLRSLDELPAMPRIVNLHVDGVASLDGAERFATTLRNLDVVGPYDDLTPLAALSALTFLRLEGERFMDLTPLTQLPNLRELVLVRERPLDLGPLAEAPQLHEVKVERCAILHTELGALNAALLPWGPDFLAPEPRPLAPLRFLNYRPQDPRAEARPCPASHSGRTHGVFWRRRGSRPGGGALVCRRVAEPPRCPARQRMGPEEHFRQPRGRRASEHSPLSRCGAFSGDCPHAA